MNTLETVLKNLINQLRDLKNEKIESVDLTEEQLYHFSEGYKQGLFSAALIIADELDAKTNCENEYLNKEEEWWNENIMINENSI